MFVGLLKIMKYFKFWNVLVTEQIALTVAHMSVKWKLHSEILSKNNGVGTKKTSVVHLKHIDGK